MINLTTVRAKATQAAAVTALAIGAPMAVFAQAKTPGQLINENAQRTAGSGGAGFNQAKKLPELVGGLIQQAMGLLGVILVVLVIYAGFLWMTAQGNDEKIKKAKGIISSAVIGLVLIFAAYAITGFVVEALINATGS